jgi:predicted secreted protein
VKPASAIAIYLLFWSITLFAVLPFGVRTADEAGEAAVPGQAESAPARPMLARKFLWTTLVSTLLFALFMANYRYGWLRLDDIPGWSHSGPYAPQ